MELDLTASHRNRRTRPWLEVTLISGFIFSLLVGLGALGALLVASRQEPTPLTTPALQTIQPAVIVPQLALAQLAGDPAEALAYQAFSAGETDTASAIVTTSTQLSGAQRLSLLLLIAQDLIDKDRVDEALIYFNLARAASVLNPSLDGNDRIKALTQIAQAFLIGENKAAALDAAQQALIATNQTPGLLPAHRSQAYEELRSIADALDDATFSQKRDELARNPYFEPSGVLIDARFASITPYNAYDEALVTAITDRMQAARILADRIELTGGVDIEPEIQTLASTLLQEDQMRSAFYQRKLGEGLSLLDQYSLLLDQRNWQALKQRVALRGFGLSLQPQWEQDVDYLQQELGATTANLHLVAEAMANELADPIAQNLLRYESLLWLSEQAELDLYPGASVDDLNNRLQMAAANLERQGQQLALPAVYSQTATPPGFRIVSAQ